MEIIPAVDLYCGKCVRLREGKVEAKTEYSGEPWLVARKWQDQGAKWLHVVDLNAAFSGKIENMEVFRKARESVRCKLQVGGGIRSIEAAREWFGAGADRIVLSTLLSENFPLASQIAEAFKGKVLASLDVIGKDGTLEGQDGSFLEGLNSVLPFYVAGGVSSAEDVVALKKKGADGVILGKALYEGRISLKEAMEAARC
ncbi:1-(5-phosphoribosyl)-5-[(5-phosphoribosylamino)methylideneamino] imidazole-4-carboxamide isomerase [Candidatus Micrarchaeota archaeon]|nr:1-(5-phosphoribosyl)-5-[(5-phosphoribosylamino)methylideneamino] imidazole-4-carboxamide isomerase [Candidatus Micrarchaeota archaeon]